MKNLTKILLILLATLTSFSISQAQHDDREEKIKTSNAETIWIVVNAMPFEDFCKVVSEVDKELNERYSGKKLFKIINMNSANYSVDLFDTKDRLILLNGSLSDELKTQNSKLITSFTVQVMQKNENSELIILQGSSHVNTAVEDHAELKEMLIKTISTVLYINEKIASR